jgi:hypothetical protein
MDFKSEKRIQVVLGNNDLVLDPIYCGYIGSISFKYGSTQSGDLTIQVIKPNINEANKIQTIANKQLTTKAYANYIGGSVYLAPGQTLRIATDINATADVWIQFSDERQSVGSWEE